MAFREWKNEYNIAVKQFNDDHKELFGYINQLHQGLVSGLGISSMSFILDALIDYSATHFKKEERLMKKHNFPGYEEHKQEHDALLKKVVEFQREFKEGKTAFSLDLLAFLDSWIVDHILKTDMKYKPFFKKIAEIQQSQKK